MHVTREVNNSGNKPKYEVFVIARDICDDIGNDFGRYILYKTLTEFDVSKLNSEVVPKFISHDNMKEHEFYFSIEEQLTQAASSFLKYKGRKELRVKNNAVDELEKLTLDESAFIELYNAAPEIAEVSGENIQSGIIITDKNSYSVIHYYGKWYLPNNNITLCDLMIGFCGDKLARQLFYRIKKGITIVRKANSFDEVKHLYKRFRIIKTKTD
ncbi:MAG: hypothetical protein JNK27_05670 [Chitinophagaceae bacterium]|nr:hypothetical protein [Chitinophagaceae bacterium]